MRPILRPALLTLLLAACGPAPTPPAETQAGPPDDAAAGTRAGEPAKVRAAASPLQGRVAAHWFGRQWPKNFLAGFRRADVADDFRQLADDGFDTVVLLVAWGDFQPGYDPCCTYDERAFERLRFLFDRADEAGLKVVLRLGYGWSFHPGAGDIGVAQQRLMNEPAVRAAYQAFLQRVSAEVGTHPAMLAAFMSWEDQWLRRIEDSARADVDTYLATLPPDAPRPDGLPDPVRDAAAFHGYWDWLVINQLYAPARPLFPDLSYEARVDREPRYEPGPDGTPVVAEWLAHAGMRQLPEGEALTIYWAPFWGALNQGERLGATRSLELLAALLAETGAEGRPLFIDQFNVVDNTPGHEHNAVLRPEEIPAFLHRAVCVMKNGGVAAYGFWTTRDYAENPLYNPAFGYGLDGWTLERAGGDAAAALEPLPSGDFQLRLGDGDVLAQRVPPRHGRLPRAGDGLEDRVCVEAEVHAPGRLRVQAGEGAPVDLAFDAPGRQRRCAAIVPVPDAEGLPVVLRGRGGDLSLREVQVFDHVQVGGLYDLEGRPGPLLEPVRRMNRDFRAATLPRCDASAQVQPVGD